MDLSWGVDRFVEWRNVGEPPESAQSELYDYETDPHETRNLAADQPRIAAELRAILAQYPEPVDPNERPLRIGQHAPRENVQP